MVGNLQGIGDLPRRLRVHDFQHDGEHARLLHRLAVTHQRFSFRLGATLYFVAPFLPDTLREHSDVSHHGNPFRHDRLNLRDVTYPALELYCLRAGFHQGARGRHGLSGIVVGVDRQIGHEQGAFHPACDGSCVMDHFGERDLRRVFVAEHHHPQ